MAKRWSSRRETIFDSDEFDLKREREYFDRHPAPRDMSDYVEHISIVRSEEEIKHRKKK